MPIELTFAGGLALGLASGLHCAGMCGGIAAGLMLLAPGGRHRRSAALRALALGQSGRILAYVAAGSVLGGIGSAFYGAFDQTAGHLLLRWSAAVAIGWLGLSTMGLAPVPAPPRRLAELAARFVRTPRLAAPGGAAVPLLSGFAWGCLPCGMVYGALFYAMMTGSAAGGAAVMAGFGLGTLPAVTGAAFGIGALKRLSARPALRTAAGALLVATGAASLLLPEIGPAILCIG